MLPAPSYQFYNFGKVVGGIAEFFFIVIRSNFYLVISFPLRYFFHLLNLGFPFSVYILPYFSENVNT